MALSNLGVPVEHRFACDVNPHAKATILANFPPKIFYDDLTVRDNAAAPKADLYVAGFPCQPFSTAGKQQGFADTSGRGTIFFKVRDYIASQEPKAFVLENVSGLIKINGGQYFKAILQSLEDLGVYNIYHQILDTKQHGVPQSRRRIYMVGIKKSCDRGNFSFPEPIEKPSIEAFLEPQRTKPTMTTLPPVSSGTARANVIRALKELKEQGRDPLREPWVIDCDSSGPRMKYVFDVTPCMTCSRAAGHWVTNRGRRMTKTEMLRLQGMKPEGEGFVKVVTDNQLGRQIGNAMSCNVLERLFVKLLPAAGLAQASSLLDRWDTTAAPSTPVSRRGVKRNCKSPSPEKRTRRRVVGMDQSQLIVKG